MRKYLPANCTIYSVGTDPRWLCVGRLCRSAEATAAARPSETTLLRPAVRSPVPRPRALAQTGVVREGCQLGPRRC